MGEGFCARELVLGGARHLLGSFSGRVCFYAKNSWVRKTLLGK